MSLTDKEEIVFLKAENARLINLLRIANDKHQSATNWAMNNAKAMYSHLRVCKHDKLAEEVAALKGQSTVEIIVPKRFNAVSLAAGRLFAKRR